MGEVEVISSLSPSTAWKIPNPDPFAPILRSARALTVKILAAASPWSKDWIPSWVRSVVDQIEKLWALEEDWDGQGACQVSDAAVTTALSVLSNAMSDDTVAPQIVPTYDGGLQLEWHFAGTDLEIYVDGVGRPSAWFREGMREWDEEVAPIQRIAKELSILTETYCR